MVDTLVPFLKSMRRDQALMIIVFAGLALLAIGQLSVHWSAYPHYSYGWSVPLLCGIALWERWKARPTPETPSRPILATRLILCLAFLVFPLLLFMEASPVQRYGVWLLVVALTGIALGLVYLTGGEAWTRHFVFPVAFFLVSVPWPGLVENLVIGVLSRWNAALSIAVLTVLGVPAIRAGNLIEITEGVVGIDEACSGIRSMQATLMVTLFIGELFHLTVRRRLVLVLLGMAFAFGLNVCRAILLVAWADSHGLQALRSWHDPAGLAILGVNFLILLALSGWSNLCQWWRRSQDPYRHSRKPGTPVVLAPPSARPLSAALLIGLTCWALGVTATIELWFRAHEKLPTQRVRWEARWPGNLPRLKPLEVTSLVRGHLRFKDSQAVQWSQPNGWLWQAYVLHWAPASSLLEQRVLNDLASGHAPSICLPNAGVPLVEDLGVKSFRVQNVEVPFHLYRFEDRGQPLFVFTTYWTAAKSMTEANTPVRPSPFIELAGTLKRILRGERLRKAEQHVLKLALWGAPSANQAESALAGQLNQILHVSPGSN